MGIVLGYKGSRDDRREAWVTMTRLRRRLRAAEEYGRLYPAEPQPDLTQTRQWLYEELMEFKAQA